MSRYLVFHLAFLDTRVSFTTPHLLDSLIAPAGSSVVLIANRIFRIVVLVISLGWPEFTC